MKNRIAVIAITLFTGFLFTGQASAQMMPGKSGEKSQTGSMMQQGGMMQGMMGQGMCSMMNQSNAGFGFYLNLKEKLGLTDAQIGQLRDLKFAFEKAAIQRNSLLQTAQLELQQLKTADKIDVGKIESKIRDVHGKQAEIEAALFQAQQNANALLTGEQLAKVKESTCPMCGQMHEGGMGEMMQGMMGNGGMMQGMMGKDGMNHQSEGQQKPASQHEQHHQKN